MIQSCVLPRFLSSTPWTSYDAPMGHDTHSGRAPIIRGSSSLIKQINLNELDTPQEAQLKFNVTEWWRTQQARRKARNALVRAVCHGVGGAFNHSLTRICIFIRTQSNQFRERSSRRSQQALTAHRWRPITLVAAIFDCIVSKCTVVPCEIL